MSHDKTTAHEIGALSAQGFELDRYVKLLDEPDMSDAQKREFVGALWGFLQNFIDAAFDNSAPETSDEARST